MYPNSFFGIVTLYDILIGVGVLLAMLVFGHAADKRKISGKLQRFTLIYACLAIVAGLGSAVLFQAIYNIEREGGFVINKGTGATFYGGLIGGVTVFLALYFIVGHLIYKKTETPSYHKENFFSIMSCAVAAVALGHGFGRLGCLTAGCCHGAITDAWYGIPMYVNKEWNTYVPTQLFEAIFLFLLFAFLFINARSKGRFNLPIYMGAYGAWRFVLEFVRNDYRGTIGFAITPSQFISILMVVGAVGVFVIEKIYTDKIKAKVALDKNEAAQGENN